MPPRGRARGEPQTSPRRISAAQRRERAVELRLAGATFKQIAAAPASPDDPSPLYPGENGHVRAHEAVMAAMRDQAKAIRDKTAELRQLELNRLDQMQVSLWPSTRPTRPVYCPERDRTGCVGVMYREVDHDAVRGVLQIMQRRTKYLRLDADDEDSGRMVALLEQQAALAQQALVGAMERAGIPPEVQREVLAHAGDILREADAGGPDPA